MKLVKVKDIPKRVYVTHDLQAMINEFVNSDHRYAKVDIGDNEYTSPTSCSESLRHAIKRSGHSLKVHCIKGIVYLEKI